MIYLKIILSLLLTAIPVYYLVYRRFFCEKGKKLPNVYSQIKKISPLLASKYAAIKAWIIRYRERLKISPSCRKFFTLMVLLLLLFVNFVDMSASDKALNNILEIIRQDNKKENVIKTYSNQHKQYQIKPEHLSSYNTYSAYITNSFSALISNVVMIFFFFYKSSNAILNKLHQSKILFRLMALVAVAILYLPGSHLLLSEIIFILLLSAVVYPEQIYSGTDPKGGLKIFEENQIKKAA